MKDRRMKSIVRAILFSSLYILSNAHISFATDWSYSGKTGSNNWSKLDKKNSACSQGKNQSPVNIQNSVKAENNPIKFDYGHTSSNMYFIGDTMTVNFNSGGFKLDGRNYELTGLVFHSPSEHQIEGKSFPLEAQFEHEDKFGNLAVVSVLFRKGVENRTLNLLLEKAPEKRHTYAISPIHNLAAKNLLPRKKDYYRINGSLTTPPCTEGVLWIIMQRKVTVSAAQIEKMKLLLKAPNNRKLEHLNSRQITR